MKPMTNEEYIDEGGNKCPFCHSKNINGLDFEADCDYASREVECHDCGKLWTEMFNLRGYEEND